MPDAIVISDDDSVTEDEDADSHDVLAMERDQVVKRSRVTSARYASSSSCGSSVNPKGKAKERCDDADADADDTMAIPSQPPSTLSNLLGGADERKRLELERRQRQRARRRAQGLKSDSDDEQDSREIKPLPSTASNSRSYVSQIPHREHPHRPAPPTIPTHFHTASTSRATSGLGAHHTGTKPALRRILASDRFWSGTVKRSYNQYTQDGVPFSDFILPTTRNNPAGLLHALGASYIYDFDWLHTILPDQTSAPAGRKAAPPPTLTFIAPQNSNQSKLDEGAIYAMSTIPGWALLGIKDIGREYVCMHMKFLLLCYPDRLRLVILTGNLIQYDWDTLENAAYIQDFPILPGSQRSTSSDTYEQLAAVLKSLSVPAAHPILKDLSRYDLRNGPTIVASLATPTNAPRRGFDQIAKCGLGRLNACVRSIMGGAVTRGGVHLEAQGSSMGSYSLRWAQQFHLAASGIDISSRLPLPSSAVASRKAYEKAVGTAGSSSSPWPPIKVLFPTSDLVQNHSCTGPSGGGCHFGKPDKFSAFRDICHCAVAARHPGVLMHQKGLLGLRGDGADKDKPIGWVYMGSANFTMNAWGNIAYPSKSSSASSSSAQPQMINNNWELGIILPVHASDVEPAAQLSTLPASCICWKRPTEAYGDDDVPWSPASAL